MHNYHIFDMDGTMVDSMSKLVLNIVDLLEQNNIDYPENIIDIITPLGIRGSAELLYEIGLREFSVDVLTQKMTEFAVKQYEEAIDLKAGVDIYLKKLKSQGKKLFVLTATPHHMTDICLKRNNIYHLFDGIWTIEDFNCKKSDPEIYKQVIKCIGCNTNEVCFYDDSRLALSAAHNIGLYTVGVYDTAAKEFKEEIENFTDKYIMSFEDLI